MQNSRFTQALLNQTNFLKADLRNSVLQGASCDTADFTEANLDNANFQRADMRCSCFLNASTRHTDFSECNLERAEFNYADCYGARFSHAKMLYSDLSYTSLINCDMTGANLLQAVLHCTDDSGANWQGASKTLIDTTNKDLAAAESWKPPRPSRT